MSRKRATTSPVSQSAIAAEAGVARTTVSLALRGGQGLSPETVERVQRAAERLGYRPNRLVHGLRSGRTGLIGVMTPPTDTFWAEVLFGVHDGLVEREYVPLVLWSNHHAKQTLETEELAQVYRLVDWRVDGAILWPWFAGLFQEHIREFTDRDLPVVTVDCQLPEHFGAHAVLSDEQMGADAVARLLREHGHQRVLHLAGPETEAWSHDRRHAFESAMAQDPHATVTVLELPLKGPVETPIRDALTGPARPTAVFAATDHFAESCYRAAQRLGLHIPGQLSIVGCGDLGFAGWLTPPLTTLQQRPYEMGRMAATLVANAVGNAPHTRHPVIERLPVRLVHRASVASRPA
jgi:LacI family transcriptional regulator